MKKAGMSESLGGLALKIPCSHNPEAKILNPSTFLLVFLVHKKRTY